MKNHKKSIIFFVSCVVFLGLSSFAYNALTKDDNSSGSETSEITTVSESGDETSSINESTDSSTTTSADTSAEDPNEYKTKAVDFTVYDKDGNEVTLSSFLGEPVVLNFWASWCPPCKGEMPEFEKVYAELGDKINFLIVDMVDGQMETKADGEKYITDNNFTFPVYYDTDQNAANAYKVTSIPRTLIINKDGYIESLSVGGISEKTLREKISAVYP